MTDVQKIMLQDVWTPGQGRVRPADSEIRSFNLKANATRALALNNLAGHRALTLKTYTERLGSVPEALVLAFDAAEKYLAAQPLIWWHNGTIRGSVCHFDITGRGMFAVAALAVPEIQSHMDVVRQIVEAVR